MAKTSGATGRMCVLPYVYRLQHKVTGKYYFGYRCANKLSAKQKISEAMKVIASTRPPMSAEHRRNISKNNARKGKPALNKGQKMSETSRVKMSVSAKKRKATDITKQKISLALTSRPVTEETRQKLSRALKGRPSPFKGKPSITKGRPKPPRTAEHCANLSLAARRRNNG